VPGADDASFSIGGTSLQTSASFDYETKNSYSICIRITDQGGLTFDKDFTISVTNVNEAPTNISLSASSVAENQPVNMVVGTLSATDPDAGATFTLGLACAVPGADDASFNISGTNLRTSASFDFETKNSYAICIRVTDQGGLSFDKNFSVAVNDVNEAPTDITLSANTVSENQPINTVVGILSAMDPDAGVTITLSLACIVAGADDSSFNINGADLRTSASFDFEAKNTYNICIRATDQGALTFDKNFTVSVNDVNEAPTNIALSPSTIAENNALNAVIGVLSAADPDAGETFTFSLACATPGVDDASFNVLGTNLRASAVFDFETKSSYTICVRATDSASNTLDKNFTITVTDVNEVPTNIALSASTIAENNPVNAVIGTLFAADPDAGEIFTFSLACATPGVDDASFNVLGTNLRASAAFDFEAKSSYAICIRVTDSASNTLDQNFTITVTDVNEVPTSIALSASTIAENNPVNAAIGTLSATDPDAGETFTYGLTCVIPGVDDASFNILGTNLRASAAFDFEAKSSYAICLRVTDCA
jgi:uncharacterized lipoprotein YbaY